MAVVINNSLGLSIIWDAYVPGDSSYAIPLKGTEIGSKSLYIWDANNDAYAPLGWDRNSGFQLRIKVSGQEIVQPAQNRLYNVNDNLILVLENNRHVVRGFREPLIVVSSPVAGSQLNESRYGGPDVVVVDWQMNDVGTMGWTPKVVLNAVASLLVKQAAFADMPVAMGLDTAASNDGLRRYRAEKVFPHPGPIQLIGQIKRGTYTESSAPVNVTVAASAARVLNARFENARSDSNPPAIGFDHQGGTVFVTLTALRKEIFRNVLYASTLTSGWKLATPWPSPVGAPPPDQGWQIQLPVGLDAHPAIHQLTVKEEDGFGISTEHPPYKFAIEDIGPPIISIIEPVEDYPFVTTSLPLRVTVRGTVMDPQTGYKPESLHYSYGELSNQPVKVDASGNWSLTVDATSYGSYSITLSAMDQAPQKENGNQGDATRQFRVVSVLQIQSFDELLSTRAYLDELLRFIRTHIIDGKNSGVNSDVVTTSFVQPFGALAQPSNPTADQVTSDLLLPVRLLRATLGDTPAAGESPAAVANYLRIAYETLLRGIGTSFEELRGLSMLSASSRQALADRLGLRTANGDDLQLLLDPYYQVAIGGAGPGVAPPQVAVRSYTRHGKTVRGYIRSKADQSLANNFGPSRTSAELAQPLTRDADRDGVLNFADPDDDNDGILDDVDPSQYALDRGSEEVWLKETFGLPSTADSVASVPSTADVPALLRAQRSALAQGWQRADANPDRWPDLDPDLVAPDDLAPSAAAWRQLLQARTAELDAKFDALVGAVLATDALSAVLSQEMKQTLTGLAQRDLAGESIAEAVAALKLEMPMFRRLVAYMGLIDAGTLLSGYEREDLAHLLVETWKRWTLLDQWRRVETQGMATQLWPTLAGNGAWVVGGGYRCDFLPWRGSAARRQALDARLAVRWRAWNDLSDALDRAVFDAQRAALPLLRDSLISLFNPPVANRDELTERWLVDVESMGVAVISPVKQAVSSLQTLVNGVRSGWFGEGHPAEKWRIKATLAAAFDDEWKWLDSEEGWRAAVMNFIYPENVLFPELRNPENVLFPDLPTVASPAFTDFLANLRAQQPLTKDSAKALNLSSLSGDELQYHAPVAIGLAFQRAGLYNLALDAYREVYEVARPIVKDTGNPKNGRKRAPLLMNEDDTLAPAPDFDADDFWTLKLSDPHMVATSSANGRRVFGNPYTRFTLMQIVRCILASADAEFASGTIDGLTKARGLYLEAKTALALPELIDRMPTAPGQVYVVNPAISALRSHVASSLLKLRNGLSILGTPLPPDLTRMAGTGTLSSLVRPTPYGFKVLIERAKQLVAIAQQFEAQYLSAIEHNEAELEKVLREGFAAQIAAQTVTLRQAGVTEAQSGKTLALAQQTRSQIERDRYLGWISAGENEFERKQMDAINAAADWRQVANGAEAAAAVASSIGQAISGWKDAGASSVAFGAAALAHAAGGVARGFAIAKETDVQISGLYASQQRREDEWLLRADIADQDVRIGDAQILLAGNRLEIATQELVIATIGSDQAQQMLSFLREKFTSAAFYDWLTGVLSETYAFFLRLAAATAQQAELQLAFARQEQPQRLVRADYWAAASQSSSADAPDRRGITGSARLLQDLYTLDQQAFSSERRMLNLTHSFSLARLLPVEFEALRRTGELTFATPMIWFDEGFPGHYMRLIKRVRLTVVALIAPTAGIRATLSNNGLSRVVTSDVGYPTMVIRQDPQSVALTSPNSSSGVFELDIQAELLQPFEGMGVDTSWTLELPPAGNPFDFDSLVDVVLSIDYTAQFSSEVKDRVVKKLPRTLSGDRTFSIRRDFPDLWYELSNSSGTEISVNVPISRRTFPPGLKGLKIDEIAVSIRDTDEGLCEFLAALAMGDHSSSQTQAVRGIASSRQSGGAGWAGVISSAGEVSDKAVNWIVKISDVPNANSPTTQSLLAQLRTGKIDDILVVATFSGIRPSW